MNNKKYLSENIPTRYPKISELKNTNIKNHINKKLRILDNSIL